MKKLTLVALTVGTLFSGSLAYSSPYYVNFGVGYVIPSRSFSTTGSSDTIFNSPTSSGSGFFNLPSVTWRNDLKNGGDFNFAVGREFATKWRGEGEIMFQSMDRDIGGAYGWQEVTPTSGDVFATQANNPINSSSASFKVYSLLANIYYDFKNKTAWTPSIGFGLGAARVLCGNTAYGNTLTINDITSGVQTTLPTLETSPAIAATTFAWQMKLGIAYFIDTNFSLTANYRLFGTSGYTVSSSEIITNPATANAATYTVGTQHANGLLNNMIDLNLRYSF